MTFPQVTGCFRLPRHESSLYVTIDNMATDYSTNPPTFTGNVNVQQSYAGEKVPTVVKTDLAGHPIISGVSVPTIAAGAQALSAVASGGGVSDAAGTITATSKSSGSVAGVLATITYIGAYTATPKSVSITPLSSVSQAVGLYVSAISATSFSVACTGTPAASTAYQFSYQIIG